LDAIVAIIREFGWTEALQILVVIGLVFAVRILAQYIQKAHEREVNDLKEAHTNATKSLTEAHIRELAAKDEIARQGWEMANAFRTQGERMADRYGEATEIARDAMDELLDRRRGRGGKPSAR
jgi:hypothetical protein